MPLSVFERRKFVRIPIHADALINGKIRGAIKTISLGGCLAELRKNLSLKDPLQVQFSVGGETFNFKGKIIHSEGIHRFAIRFENIPNEEKMRLVHAIERVHEISSAIRPTRVRLQRNAQVDRKPATLVNISEGGCFVETGTSFHPNDIVEIKFNLDQDENHLAGQVRWVDSGGIGIEYLSPEPNQIYAISTFISAEKSRPSS